MKDKKYLNVSEKFGDAVVTTYSEYLAMVALYPEWGLDVHKFEIRRDDNLYYDGELIGEAVDE